jgi:MFS family permease
MMRGMRAWLGRLHPFQTPAARRLAGLFAVVYFAQGMWYLPDQAITIVLKERGLGAGEVATFFLVARFTWNVKPLYGLCADFVPLFGRRRQSWFWLSSGLAAAAGLALSLGRRPAYGWLLAGFTTMGLGLAFTDVLTDALMVESGKPLGLTGAFQAVQWAAISAASVVSGVVGGRLAETRDLGTTFAVATVFPLVSLGMALAFVREPPVAGDPGAVARRTWRAVRAALRDRTVWIVAGFILFWNFSPSFGPAMVFYQTDTLHFSQTFIGRLAALGAAGGIAGAVVFAPWVRRRPLRRSVAVAIGLGTAGTLGYLAYRGPVSAVVIDTLYGAAGMVALLAFLDLAAKTCPRHVEATFFALLMSVNNVGLGLGQWAGGQLFDRLGFTPLVLISAAVTASAFLLLPLVPFEEIAARAAAGGEAGGGG